MTTRTILTTCGIWLANAAGETSASSCMDSTRPALIGERLRLSVKGDGMNIPIWCKYDALIPIEQVKPYPRNNKKHPPAQLDLLSKIIATHGWRTAITVSNLSGYVVRGHARLAAAKKLGLNVVPIDYQDYDNKKTEAADRIADNKIAELAKWDMSNLADELGELKAEDFDTDLTGFNQDDLKKMLEREQDDIEFSEPGFNDAKTDRFICNVSKVASHPFIALLRDFKKQYPDAFSYSNMAHATQYANGEYDGQQADD